VQYDHAIAAGNSGRSFYRYFRVLVQPARLPPLDEPPAWLLLLQPVLMQLRLQFLRHEQLLDGRLPLPDMFRRLLLRVWRRRHDRRRLIRADRRRLLRISRTASLQLRLALARFS
jgi:hypothetical protein